MEKRIEKKELELELETMDTYMYEAVEENKAKQYALKQSRLRIAQDFLRKAAPAASDAARRIYWR